MCILFEYTFIVVVALHPPVKFPIYQNVPITTTITREPHNYYSQSVLTVPPQLVCYHYFCHIQHTPHQSASAHGATPTRLLPLLWSYSAYTPSECLFTTFYAEAHTPPVHQLRPARRWMCVTDSLYDVRWLSADVKSVVIAT